MSDNIQIVVHDPIALLAVLLVLVLAGGAIVVAIELWRIERKWTRRARERGWGRP
jgi:hypothetical protein